jgi:hypothetical protein
MTRRIALTTEQPTETTAAVLFDSLWENLADLLGTAATATLIRRAAKRAAAGHTEFPTVIVNRDKITYEYKLPDSWRDPNRRESLDALRRLQRHTAFAKHGIRFAEESTRP